MMISSRWITLPVRFALLLLFFVGIHGTVVQANDTAAWRALKEHGIVLFRHAHAPGNGDPSGIKLGDCGTQRNLDATGRDQARRVGAKLKEQDVAVGRVLASQWCRTTETAELMVPGRVELEPAFNSFFDDKSKGAAQTETARALLAAWKGPGALVVVTHHVNIQALTGIAVGSSEGVVVKVVDSQVVVVGRLGL